MEQKLGRYIIEEQLGEGSFAFVYRAKDEDLDRYVALKVLKPIWMSDPTAIGRFKQEARTMAKLDKNAHIAVVYEVGEAEGQVYLSQLLVDGETLADRLARGALTWPEILDIMRPIASALDYAHSQGVIHRDIKPANILLDKEGKPYLGDFGLVRAAEGSASLSASIAGVKGTAAYIPPEVWDGEEVTPATDIYALSCVVFEMLTGTVLYDGSSMMAVMRQIDRGPEFPERWPEGIPQDATAVLQKGLAADPADRYKSASELASALENLDPSAEAVPAPVVAPAEAESPETPAAAVEPEPLPPVAPAAAAAPTEPVRTPEPAAAPPAKKGGRGLAIAGVVVVLLIIAGAGFFLLGGGTDEPDSAPAPAEAAVVAEVDDEPEEEPTPLPTEPPEPTAAIEEPTPVPTAEPTPEATAEIVPEPAEETDLDPVEIADQAWNNLDQGNIEEAIADFDVAIELDPDNADLYDGRGWSYYLSEQYDQALADIDQAIELDPNVALYHFDRGVIYGDLGEYEQAISSFNEALTLAPNDQSRAEILVELGVTYESLGETEQAVASLQEAVASFEAGGAAEEEYAWIAERIDELAAELDQAVAEVEAPSPEATELPLEEPTATPVPDPTATPVPAAVVSGHIAIPLLAGDGTPKVFIADTDGNQVAVLDSARQPAHTQDGSRLVVNGDGGTQLLLRMANSDGSNAREFGNPTLNSHSHPAWSPDGTQVIYNDRFGTQDYHIFTRSLDSTEGEGEELFTEGRGQIFLSNPSYPRWTTQDRFIFRSCDTWTGQAATCGLWLLQGQLGQARRLTENVNHIPTDVSGDTVVFVFHEGGGNWNVYKLDLNGGGTVQLTTDPAADSLATISPDGKSVAFLSNRGGKLAVWYVSINGGEPKKMFDVPAEWGALRPDGWSEETLSWGQ